MRLLEEKDRAQNIYIFLNHIKHNSSSITQDYGRATDSQQAVNMLVEGNNDEPYVWKERQLHWLRDCKMNSQ